MNGSLPWNRSKLWNQIVTPRQSCTPTTTISIFSGPQAFDKRLTFTPKITLFQIVRPASLFPLDQLAAGGMLGAIPEN
jgi:hypothetical protein